MRDTTLILISLAALSGCNGVIDDPSAAGSEETSHAPACTDDPLHVPLARLGSSELASTLEGLLPASTFEAIGGELALVPIDGASESLDATRRDITADHVRAHAVVADAVGAHLASTPEARAELAPCLATAADRACVTELVRGWGARAWRRPLEEDEVAETLALYDSVLASDGETLALRAVVSSMLLAPAFVFRVEQGDGPTDGRVELTAHELASRLAFVLWGEAPDARGLSAAAAGALDGQEGLAAEVDRLLADPRARKHLSRLVSQWLLLDRDVGIDDVPAHIAEGLETDGLSAAAAEEARRLVEHLVWEEGAGLAELMTTDLSFVGHPGLAAIYGVPETGWDTPVSLGDGRRGLLTRIVLLADPGGEQHPIYRGRRVRERLLCGKLYPPDPDTLPPGSLETPPIDPTQSSRDRFEAHTASPQCAGCHQQINPLGFALGGFDGLGRARDVERIFDESGTLIGMAPVDTAVDPVIEAPGAHRVDGAVELGALLATERNATACAASRYVESAIGRERARADSCAIDESADALARGGFLEMVRQFVTAPSFRARRIEP